MTRDDHTPIERRAGQSARELAEAMEAAPALPRQFQVDPSADKSVISRAIAAHIGEIAQPRRVNLSDVEAVRESILIYLQACSIAQRVPTVAGLAAAMGHSRRNIYGYLQRNENASTALLGQFQTACADCLMQAGLSNASNVIMSIFLLKNSGQGLADRSELEITARADNNPFEQGSPEDIARKYVTGLAEPESAETGSVDQSFDE